MTSHSATLQFSVPGPCEFPLIVRGHGWYDLEPNAWCAESERLDTAFSLAGQVFSCRLGARQGRIRVVVTSTRPLEATTRAALRAAVLRMLRFDEDFEDFWTRPGYLGHDNPESFAGDRLQFRTSIAGASLGPPFCT